MSEDRVTIEINGTSMEVRKGAMLIEASDEAGITIPRFCYHKKLSVAANCRMCLVEVERAPKPVPACATPVVEGMKVFTDSPKAMDAQKGTMEFLLINHPLDCPICDQGGECELQDLAMGYGGDVSRFVERKRVVKDKNIGPLIKTEMTRCIHCTRCVRFGEEIANLRELGATGRGEHMEIGTYIEKTLVSELSGNVIDLCPVGALTAKPSRYAGRSWEYLQRASVAPHDAVGSNLWLHTLRDRVMRVVPRDNEPVNETWLSDRDRFSYQGMYSPDRVERPLLRDGGAVRTVDWKTALDAVFQRLGAVIDRHGPDAVGFLVSPTATLEEMYLAARLARGLGVRNIDHRLRQGDFSDQRQAPVYPWLGMPLSELEVLDAVLLVGSNPRLEQPLACHRLRKAAKAGANVMAINPRHFDLLLPLAAEAVAAPAAMITVLGGVARAVAELADRELPKALAALLDPGRSPTDLEQAMAKGLVDGGQSAVLLGNLALAHPALAQLRALAGFIAAAADGALGYLPEAGNAAGGWLAGVLPHREAGGKPLAKPGLHARAMLEQPRKAYVLIGVEPELDCYHPAAALAAMGAAECVVCLTPFASPLTHDYGDLILPTATFAETSGSFVNAEGRCQSFEGAVKPLGEARPAWKVLRVLGNRFGLPGFDYLDSRSVLEEVLDACADLEPRNRVDPPDHFDSLETTGLYRMGDVPIYAVDALVRRADALQQTPWAAPPVAVLHPDTARRLGVEGAERVRVRQGGGEAELPLVLDLELPEGCLWLPAGVKAVAALGPVWGAADVTAV